jgi:hypothetical protein
METILIIVVIIAALFGLVKAAGTGRYEKMSEKEFEAEAQRTSRMGGALMEFQKAVDPSHKVEYVDESAKRLEADSAESGDKPDSRPARPKSEE